MSDNVLEIKNLKIVFNGVEGRMQAVNDLSLEIPRGKVLALVGESGCGKSVTSFSILRLIQKPGQIAGGQILFKPPQGEVVDMAALSEKDERLFDLRGNRISMIFQEPMTALSPVHTIGSQLCEVLLEHGEKNKDTATKKAIEMLAEVGIPAPERRINQYAFELSGGMRQRVVIAMAMLARPDLLIADEPTTALDVTIQAQVLQLMKRIQRETGNSLLLVTHDLCVVAQMADYVAVMYLGRIVEKGPMRAIIKNPRHPYTIALLESLPGSKLEKGRLPSIKGMVPGLGEIPNGCPFHPRCQYARPGLCDRGGVPDEVEISSGQSAACRRLVEIESERNSR